METVMSILQTSSEILWGPWTPWVLLGAGVLFTVWSKFTQYTALSHGFAVVQGKYDNPDDPGAINHFQALSAALSATVGLGNIGGVALAIGIGGPGALFWMWIVGVLGMALKTVEITLAMMYRNVDDPDNPHGGAMWVVDRVLGDKGGIYKTLAKIIGVIFCITLLISSFTGGNMFQAWSVAELTEGFFGIPKIATGIVMVVLVGLVIIGGIKRIGNVAGKLVPFMCGIYLLAAFAVLAFHVTEIPGMLKLVVSSAFDSTQATGAFIGGSMGFAFIEGMKRALFSNEAGQGSAPIAHAAAKTSEPAREGIVGGLGPFIDTICICTLTALVIISTGTWDRAAIGDFGGEITLSQKLTDAAGNALEVPTWEVKGGTDFGLLPEPRYEPWGLKSRLYMVATVKGAEHAASGRALVQIKGEVVAKMFGGSDEAQQQLMIKWSDAVFKPKTWNGAPTEVTLLNRGVHRRYDGANLTAHAFDREFAGLGKWLVTFAAWLFAISTMISWSYYGEQGVIYMVGERGILPYKFLFLVAILYASAGINNVDDMIILMDVGTGAMLWANLPIVIGLGYLAVNSLNDYRRKLKAGEFPRYDT
jgi:AGCS family alanine or glycine:cation symporter